MQSLLILKIFKHAYGAVFFVDTVYNHNRQLRCVNRYVVSKTTSTTVTSIVHSKLSYCNSLYYNRPKSQITRLQQTTTVSHVLLSKLEYQLLSFTSFNLHNFITVQSHRSTRSSSLVTRSPTNIVSLRIIDHSFDMLQLVCMESTPCFSATTSYRFL